MPNRNFVPAVGLGLGRHVLIVHPVRVRDGQGIAELSDRSGIVFAMARQVQVAIDCADPEPLARFWAEVLDCRIEDPPVGYPTWSAFSRSVGVDGEAWCAVVDPAGVGPRVLFHRVPEGKTCKNRVHLDVRVAGGQDTPKQLRRPLVDAEIGRLVGLGARHLRTEDDDTDYFAVMLDPEGNEFCAC